MNNVLFFNIMRVLKNDELTARQIKQLRIVILAENKDVQFFLGLGSSNINKALPLKARDFEIWVAFFEKNEILGFVSFCDGYEGSKFIKVFYILPKYRRYGYGKELFHVLKNEYEKLECRTKPDNQNMYKFLKSVGMRCEKPILNNSNLSINDRLLRWSNWWSNYKSDKAYESVKD